MILITTGIFNFSLLINNNHLEKKQTSEKNSNKLKIVGPTEYIKTPINVPTVSNIRPNEFSDNEIIKLIESNLDLFFINYPNEVDKKIQIVYPITSTRYNQLGKITVNLKYKNVYNASGEYETLNLYPATFDLVGFLKASATEKKQYDNNTYIKVFPSDLGNDNIDFKKWILNNVYTNTSEISYTNVSYRIIQNQNISTANDIEGNVYVDIWLDKYWDRTGNLVNGISDELTVRNGLFQGFAKRTSTKIRNQVVILKQFNSYSAKAPDEEIFPLIKEAIVANYNSFFVGDKPTNFNVNSFDITKSDISVRSGKLELNIQIYLFYNDANGWLTDTKIPGSLYTPLNGNIIIEGFKIELDATQLKNNRIGISQIGLSQIFSNAQANDTNIVNKGTLIRYLGDVLPKIFSNIPNGSSIIDLNIISRDVVNGVILINVCLSQGYLQGSTTTSYNQWFQMTLFGFAVKQTVGLSYTFNINYDNNIASSNVTLPNIGNTQTVEQDIISFFKKRIKFYERWVLGNDDNNLYYVYLGDATTNTWNYSIIKENGIYNVKIQAFGLAKFFVKDNTQSQNTVSVRELNFIVSLPLEQSQQTLYRIIFFTGISIAILAIIIVILIIIRHNHKMRQWRLRNDL